MRSKASVERLCSVMRKHITAGWCEKKLIDHVQGRTLHHSAVARPIGYARADRRGCASTAPREQGAESHPAALLIEIDLFLPGPRALRRDDLGLQTQVRANEGR